MAGIRSVFPPTIAKPYAFRPTPPMFLAGQGKWAVPWRRNGGIAATGLGRECSDPLLQAALRAAALRFQESLRPDSLFIDPYASCLLSPAFSYVESEPSPTSCHYRLATKFIDDKLLSFLRARDELGQIVLLTDGMDTRPYRLSWPRLSVIFDISPPGVFNVASARLKGAGAKIPRNCILLHVPLESTELQDALIKRGFDGNKPSLWAIQGLPMSTLSNFIDTLSLVGSSAAKGSIFMGELPASLAGADFETWDKGHEWIERFFMSHGFQVNIVGYDEITEGEHSDESSVNNKSLLFSAEQLRFSDAQESWIRLRAHLFRLCSVEWNPRWKDPFHRGFLSTVDFIQQNIIFD